MKASIQVHLTSYLNNLDTGVELLRLAQKVIEVRSEVEHLVRNHDGVSQSLLS